MSAKQFSEMERSLTRDRIREGFAKYGVVVGIVVLLLVFTASTDTFFQWNNFSNILKTVSINGFLAIGMMMVIVTGGIDLSVGPNVALSGILCSMVLQQTNSALWALLTALGAGLLIGLLNGLAVAYTAVPAFIVTLSMQTICKGAVLIISGGYPINAEHPVMNFVGRKNILGIPTSVVVLLVLAILSWVILNRTKIGRYIYAIGGNVETTKLSGVRVGRYTTFAYAFIGFMAGVVAYIMTGRLASATPTIGTGYELDAVAAAVLGGTAFTGGIGTVEGALLGAIFIGLLNNGMTLLAISPYVQNIFKGVIIFGAVFVSVFSSRKKN